MKHGLIVLCVLLFIAPAPAFAFTYQGEISESGVPFDGTADLRFRLYNAETDGSQIGNADLKINVVVTEGRFIVALDKWDDFLDGSSYWLEIAASLPAGGALTKLNPRQKVDSAPYASNADKLEGLNAAEIVAAADTEPRTPIDSLPFYISQPGSYYLSQNLTGSTIYIQTSDVTIDFMGFTLACTSANGISTAGNDNLIIKNGTIRSCTESCIDSAIYAPSQVRIHQMTVTDCNQSEGDHAAIFLSGSHNMISESIVSDNGGVGVHLATNVVIRDSIVNGNGDNGIRVSTGAVRNNLVNENDGHGILIAYNGTVADNTIYGNGLSGIKAEGNNEIVNNTVNNNNYTGSLVDAGIHVQSSNLIVGNHVGANKYVGINLVSGHNLVRENHVINTAPASDNSWCFYFTSNDNTAVGNTATGCEFNFGGALPANVQFIDNIGW